MVNCLEVMLGGELCDVLFVGYQAEGRPGRQIQRFGPRGGYLVMDGQRYDIRAQVHIMGGYSVHADQNGLIGSVTRMRHWPSEVRIVHGKGVAKQQLGRRIQERYELAHREVEIVV